MPLPTVDTAVIAIKAVAALDVVSREPYRAAAYDLGWGFTDGTQWWNDVMSKIG